MKRKPRTKRITKNSHSCESFKISQMLICFLKRSLELCHERWSGKLTWVEHTVPAERQDSAWNSAAVAGGVTSWYYPDIWPDIERPVNNGDIIESKKEAWMAAVNHLDDLSFTFNEVQETFFRYLGPYSASLCRFVSCTSMRLTSHPSTSSICSLLEAI